MSKKIVLYCALFITAMNAICAENNHSNEEYFLKVHKDKSIGIFKKQMLDIGNGIIVTQKFH